MGYLTQDEIAGNAAMNARVAQCAAEEGNPDPDAWTGEHRREWGAAPGWAAAWDSAKASNPDWFSTGYDPGRDEAVITDGMILSQVQAMGGGAPPPGV